MTEKIGEFEQLVMLAILQLGRDAHAAALRAHIETQAARRVTRGALYATLERLTAKELLSWEVEAATPARGGIPRRRFLVTTAGLESLRRSHAALRALTRGLEELLGDA